MPTKKNNEVTSPWPNSRPFINKGKSTTLLPSSKLLPLTFFSSSSSRKLLLFGILGLKLTAPGRIVCGKGIPWSMTGWENPELGFRFERIKKVAFKRGFLEGWNRERSKSESPEKKSSSRVPTRERWRNARRRRCRR